MTSCHHAQTGRYVTVCTMHAGFDARSAQSRQNFEMDYTLRMLNTEDSYQNHLLRSKLTRNMDITFDKVQGELVQALADHIPVADDGM